jgi:cyclophilin family peptidyl-prolyl cis-trans isomerase
MTEDRKYVVVGTIVLLVAVILGLVVYKKMGKNLPSGKMTQTDLTSSASATQNETIKTRPQVKIGTSKGEFIIELRPDVAPKTVANFLSKFANGYCDGLTWHRVEDWVVQGCDPVGDGTGGNSTLPTETSGENFGIGVVGVARRAFPKEVSNDSQFFITKKDASFLNGEYTYFGKVLSGMNIVNSLAVGDKILETTILSK